MSFRLLLLQTKHSSGPQLIPVPITALRWSSAQPCKHSDGPHLTSVVITALLWSPIYPCSHHSPLVSLNQLSPAAITAFQWLSADPSSHHSTMLVISITLSIAICSTLVPLCIVPLANKAFSAFSCTHNSTLTTISLPL